MKKIIAAIMMLVIVLALASCAKTNSNEKTVNTIDEIETNESNVSTDENIETNATESEDHTEHETENASEESGTNSNGITVSSGGMVADDITIDMILKDTDLIVCGKVIHADEGHYTNPTGSDEIINKDTGMKVANCFETTYDFEIDTVIYGDKSPGEMIPVCTRNRLYILPSQANMVGSSDNSEYYLTEGTEYLLFLRDEEKKIHSWIEKGESYSSVFSTGDSYSYLIRLCPAGSCEKYISDTGEERYRSGYIDISIEELETILNTPE